MAEESQEKDKFWIYIGCLIAVIIVGVLVIKSSEHDKFETTKKAIAESSEYSAYKNSKL